MAEEAAAAATPHLGKPDVDALKEELRGKKPSGWDVIAFQRKVQTMHQALKQYILDLPEGRPVSAEMGQYAVELRDMLKRLPNPDDHAPPVVDEEHRTVAWGGKVYRFVDQLSNRLFDGSTFISWSMVPEHVRAILIRFLEPSK